jgi:hypothetical protein
MGKLGGLMMQKRKIATKKEEKDSEEEKESGTSVTELPTLKVNPMEAAI